MGQKSDKLEAETLESLMNRPVEGRERPAAGCRGDEPDTTAATIEDDQQLMSTQLMRQVLGKNVTAADDDADDDDELSAYRPL